MEIVIGLVLFVAVALAVRSSFLNKRNDPQSGPAYARDPNGKTIYGVGTDIERRQDNSGYEVGPAGEYYPDTGRNATVVSGWCMVTRSQCLTGNPGVRWDDFVASQGSWPEITVTKEIQQLPAPQKALPQPNEELSIFDTYRDKQGVYRVSDTGNTEL